MADFSLQITNWYRLNKRALPWRDTKNPYFIWLSEIIMQQTRVDQGLKYYLKFISNYPTVSDLATANEQDVLNDWQGLGYYSRARNLHAAAQYITNELGGVFPTNYKDILALKGVGIYTASAIASFAFDEKTAVVDGNVYRLLSRFFNDDTPIDSTQGKKRFQHYADELISADNPGEHNQAIMEMGSLVCSPKPKCDICVLQEQCMGYSEGTFLNLPVKKKKVRITPRYFHYLIFTEKDSTIITQRTEKDIWKNMFQFPLIEVPDEHTVPEICSQQLFESSKVKHILSHQHIYCVFHHFDKFPDHMEENWRTIKKSEIQDFPLPRIIDRYLEKEGSFF